MQRGTNGIIISLFLSILLALLNADAQRLTKVPHIGVISFVSPADRQQSPFLQGLRELGYVEGQNILIDWRSHESSDERAHDLAAELVRLKVDVIVALGGPAARGAKKATSTIPIAMSVGDALGQGLVASLARPGENTTGVTSIPAELSQNRLQLLREALPQLARVAVLWCLDLAGNPPQWREIQDGASRLGLQLQSLEVRSPDDFEPAFEAATRDGAEALFVANCALFISARKQIVTLAGKHRLPAIYPFSSDVVAGGLMAYGAAPGEGEYRLAVYVDKILKGAKPADLPMEQPKKFELAINLKTAKALSLTIPPSLLFQADKVIQ
jgi:putative tryptophan/tyrosine transport system substrate-binding protein